MKRFALLLTVFAQLGAHDLYLMPAQFSVTPGQRSAIAIHNGDSFPDSENAPVLSRLRDVKLGSTAVEKLREEKNRAVGEVAISSQGSLILTTRSIPNFIELKAVDFDKYLLEEGLDDVRLYRKEHGEMANPGRERYAKFAKAILTSGVADEGYKKLVGFAIEIIPEQNPASIKIGGELSVQVRFGGKPASRLSVEASNESETKIVGRLDSAGRIRIPITRTGRWRIHTLAMRRATEPNGSGDASPEAKSTSADWESFWASLTFEIRP